MRRERAERDKERERGGKREREQQLQTGCISTSNAISPATSKVVDRLLKKKKKKKSNKKAPTIHFSPICTARKYLRPGVIFCAEKTFFSATLRRGRIAHRRAIRALVTWELPPHSISSTKCRASHRRADL